MRGNNVSTLVTALVATGFTQIPENDTIFDYYLPCPVGKFSNSSSQGAEGCIPCPPGNFYSLFVRRGQILFHRDLACFSDSPKFVKKLHRILNSVAVVIFLDNGLFSHACFKP